MTIIHSVKPPALGVAALAATVLLAGCGGTGPSGNPATTAQNFLHALSDGDPGALCQVTADERTGPAKKGSAEWDECLATMDQALAEAGNEFAEYSGVTVDAATVDGTEATVSKDQIKGVAEPAFAIDLTMFGDTWYVTDF